MPNFEKPTPDELKQMEAADRAAMVLNVAAIVTGLSYIGYKLFQKQVQQIVQAAEEYSPVVNHLKDNAMSACGSLGGVMLAAGVVVLAHKMGKSLGNNLNL